MPESPDDLSEEDLEALQEQMDEDYEVMRGGDEDEAGVEERGGEGWRWERGEGRERQGSRGGETADNNTQHLSSPDTHAPVQAEHRPTRLTQTYTKRPQ